MKKVCFIISNPRWGTFHLRGVQISRELRKLGIKSSVVRTRHIDKVKNSICIFVKRLPSDKIEPVKNNGNRIIWDILDLFTEKNGDEPSPSPIDGLILSTAASAQSLSSIGAEHRALLYHHIDPRLAGKMRKIGPRREFSIAYIGNLLDTIGGEPFHRFFPEVAVIETDTRHAERTGWMNRIGTFSCHFAVRLDPVACRMKPLAKVGVAAACGAPIIVNRSNAAVELLGETYPFICDDSVESAGAMIAAARDAFGGPVWRQAVHRMEQLRERLSLKNSAAEYAAFLNKFR